MQTQDQIDNLKKLIERYYEGKTTREEEIRLYDYFSKSDVNKELRQYRDEFVYYQNAAGRIVLSDDKNDWIAQKLPDDIRLNRRKGVFDHLFAGIIILFLVAILAFFAGYFISSSRIKDEPNKKELEELKAEMSATKQLLVRHMLELEQNYQKLYAITLATNLENLDDETLNKILWILKEDENVNIRLAAAEVFFHFGEDERVQQRVVEAFQGQVSPLIVYELVKIVKNRNKGDSEAILQKVLNDKGLTDSLKTQIEEIYHSI